MALPQDEIAPTSRYFISGQAFNAPQMAPGLYLVATPIGNLKDITLRALETLAAADLILCEDTRTSAKLLTHFGIKGKKSALHEHNERAKTQSILSQIESGMAIALISDAGTPLLSDPGFPLVAAAREAALSVFAIPGPSALLAAVTSAGLPMHAFTFLGFLPPKSKARQTAISPFVGRGESLIVYESARRLAATIADIGDVLDDRQIVVQLELTKKYERQFSGPASELTEFFQENPQKGEAVIVVGGQSEAPLDDDTWRDELANLLKTQSVRDAVAEITSKYGLTRKKVYDAALELK